MNSQRPRRTTCCAELLAKRFRTAFKALQQRDAIEPYSERDPSGRPKRMITSLARDEAEVLRIIQYIEHNPVKAGFVDQPSDWRCSSAWIRQRLGIVPGSPVPRT